MKFESVGKNIRRYRKEKKMSQEKLAEMAYLSPTYLGMIERADKTPSLTTLVNIANALNVTADMLLCDVLNRHNEIRSSLIFDNINKLSEKEKERIYAIIEAFLKYSK
ncbi:MAG: helix-turn-helix domain-containing protein [Ruminococcus sp.]|nr:helix-turn-helix domain-containing protein [Ruminococcus sp.]